MTAPGPYPAVHRHLRQLCTRRFDHYSAENTPTWSPPGKQPLTKIVAIVEQNLSSGRLHAITGLPQQCEPGGKVLTKYVDRVIRCYDHTHLLVERLRADDAGAWRQMYQDAYRVSFRMLSRCGSSSPDADAEELAQVACETVFRKRYPYDVSFEAWTAKIAVRCVLMRGRSQDALDCTNRYSLDRLAGEDAGLDPADGYDFLSDEKSLQVFERVEQHDDCLRAMSEMRSGMQRHVIEYLYLEGLSTEETAQRLNISVGAVHTLHHRGLRSLKRLLYAAPLTW